MTINTLEEAQAAAVAAQRAADQELAFYLFFRERPDLNNEANKRLITEFHDGQPITLDSIRQSVVVLESQDQLAVKTVAEQRESEAQRVVDSQAAQAQQIEELREELAQLHWQEQLRNPATASVIKEIGKTVREYRQNSFVKRLQHMSLAELEAKKAEFETTARLRGLGYEDLKVVARREYAATHPQPGQQAKVSMIPAEYDYKFFKKLDRARYEQAVKLYGMDQITRRNFGDDAAEVRLRTSEFERGLQRL